MMAVEANNSDNDQSSNGSKDKKGHGDSVSQSQSNEEERLKYFRMMARCEPMSYNGEPDPDILERWLNKMNKLFDFIKCPEKLWVDIAAFYLEDRASIWWSGVKKKEVEVDIEWEQLKKLMRKKFYPKALCFNKFYELRDLKQESLTVFEYYSKFTNLLICLDFLDENDVLSMFMKGLNSYLKDKLLSASASNYHELYDMAANAECFNQGRLKRKAVDHDYYTSEEDSEADGPSSSSRGRSNHSNNSGARKKCFRCESAEHLVRNCPQF